MSQSARSIPDVERVNLMLEAAIRAPSGHNTQPWRFYVAKDRIELHADRTRALAVTDPEDRELVISCGCALLNLRVAAAHAGAPLAVELTPDPADEDLLAVARFTGTADADRDDPALFGAIARRRTYRRRFDTRTVPVEVVTGLEEAAAAEGAWLAPLTAEADRHRLAELVSEGDAAQWADPRWRRELAMWMHPRRAGDGLSVPGIVAPMAQTVVRTFDMGGGVAAKDAELAEESPLLAVLGTGADGVTDWLHAGQGLERVLLTAQIAGLQASYLNQPVQVTATRPKLQHLVGRAGFPQLVLRLGYPTSELPPSPRRSLQDMLD